MAEDEGRPTFDLSSFSTFTFPAVEKSEALPEESSGIAESYHKKFHVQQEDFSRPKTEPLMLSEDEVLIDLTRYGPPDALAKLNQNAPMTVIAVIEHSIDNIRTQAGAEIELRHREDQIRRQPADERDQLLSVDQILEIPDKGKEVPWSLAVQVSTPTPSIASDNTDTASFYTPPEGQSSSANVRSRTEADVPTAEDRGPYFTRSPRSEAATNLGIPRRRDVIKAMFRKMSDIDTRRRVLHRSTGPLPFKEKLRHAKQIWQGEVQIGFVSLITRSLLSPLIRIFFRSLSKDLAFCLRVLFSSIQAERS